MERRSLGGAGRPGARSAISLAPPLGRTGDRGISRWTAAAASQPRQILVERPASIQGPPAYGARASFHRVAGSRHERAIRPRWRLARHGHLDTRRAGPIPGAIARRARLVCRLPVSRARDHLGAAPPLPLPLGGQGVGLAPPDRSAEAAPEANSAQAACRCRAAHPTARVSPWLSSRPLDRDLRRAACRTDHRSQDGPSRFLRFDHERPCHLALSHRGLPRGRGVAVNGPVHQHRPAGRLEAVGRPGSRAVAFTGKLALKAALPPAAPASRRADLASAREPGRLPARCPAGRLGRSCRGPLHALRRRSALLGRRSLCALDSPLPDPRRSDRSRGRICRHTARRG